MSRRGRYEALSDSSDFDESSSSEDEEEVIDNSLISPEGFVHTRKGSMVRFAPQSEIHPRAQKVLDYMFSEHMHTNVMLWFDHNVDNDEAIERRFNTDIKRAILGDHISWENDPEEVVALLILLAQFPRHLMPTSRKMFWTDELAVGVALRALNRSLYDPDFGITPGHLIFVLLPLTHSEDLELQRRCCFEWQRISAGLAQGDVFHVFDEIFELHYKIIERFGRFPHRNATYGRSSSHEELEFIKSAESAYLPLPIKTNEMGKMVYRRPASELWSLGKHGVLASVRFRSGARDARKKMKRRDSDEAGSESGFSAVSFSSMASATSATSEAVTDDEARSKSSMGAKKKEGTDNAADAANFPHGIKINYELYGVSRMAKMLPSSGSADDLNAAAGASSATGATPVTSPTAAPPAADLDPAAANAAAGADAANVTQAEPATDGDADAEAPATAATDEAAANGADAAADATAVTETETKTDDAKPDESAPTANGTENKHKSKRTKHSHRAKDERAQAVLKFMFRKTREECLRLWMGRAKHETDDYVREHFRADVHSALLGEYIEWENNAQEAVALVILLDQFPRCIWRNTAQMFWADRIARSVALRALERYGGKARKHSLAPVHMLFLLFPLMHSEDVQLLRKASFEWHKISLHLDPADPLRVFDDIFEHHTKVVEKYNRYPHRNVVLNRPSTPEEEEFLKHNLFRVEIPIHLDDATFTYIPKSTDMWLQGKKSFGKRQQYGTLQRTGKTGGRRTPLTPRGRAMFREVQKQKKRHLRRQSMSSESGVVMDHGLNFMQGSFGEVDTVMEKKIQKSYQWDQLLGNVDADGKSINGVPVSSAGGANTQGLSPRLKVKRKVVEGPRGLVVKEEIVDEHGATVKPHEVALKRDGSGAASSTASSAGSASSASSHVSKEDQLRGLGFSSDSLPDESLAAMNGHGADSPDSGKSSRSCGQVMSESCVIL
eukprot:TRINITY_DN2303_c0_g1_i1.p1 TRINITY_DN2303_c0_g1~~TRINITY_DN2303_c0_g1_i1.p1  ORF type:complete len:980 (+),score=443.51 TRINITY_DN2303_c0_g1_i1:67-2940(+)